MKGNGEEKFTFFLHKTRYDVSRIPAMKIHALLLLSACAVLAETTVVPSFDSVGMFKNGLAVVRVSFPVGEPGQYVWEKVPHIVHGSLWVESDGEVSVLSTTRKIEEKDETESPAGNLQKDLAGKEVTVTFGSRENGDISLAKGTVWDVPAAATSRTWDTDYSSLNPNSGSYYWQRNQISGNGISPPQSNTGNFLVLREADGTRSYISQGSISSVSVAGPFEPATRTVEKPVLVFDVRRAPAKGGTVMVTYLTKGLAWLPSYRLDLTDPKKLSIRQNAVVRNEMGDVENTELQLISGFPNVRFGSVDSPLWPGTRLSAFFQQVNQSGSNPNGILSNALSQQAVYLNNPSRSDGPPLPDVAEEGNVSDDIHYHSIGKRSLKAGDSLSLDVAAAGAEYKRVVEWTVPDPRDGNGRYRNSNGNQPPAADGEAWDAVSFKNPYDFPMTTAAATIVEGGRFRGQSISEWVNPGQQACVKITRALSIRTEAGETEEEGERQIVYIGGDDYQRTTVKGRLAVRNFRGKDVTLTIRCEFSGKLLEADGDPKSSLRVEGATSVNPRRQLDWTITLPAGAEKELTYRYEVLVNR